MQIAAPRHVRTGLLAVVMALVLAIAGCGSNSSTSTTTVAVGANLPAGGAKTAKTAPGSADVVATVGGVAIAKAAYEHWLAVTAALSGKSASAASQAVKDKALGFLITEQWVLGEAAARGIAVSAADVKKRLEGIDRKQFKKSGELQKYLSKAHETTADLQQRVKLELLESAIAEKVTASKHTSAEKQAALNKLQDEFEKRWKARTSCQPGYVMEDCK